MPHTDGPAMLAGATIRCGYSCNIKAKSSGLLKAMIVKINTIRRECEEI